MQEDVSFVVDGKKVAFRYDRNRLRLGATVYVGRDSDRMPVRFSPDQFDGAEKLSVTWIAPSNWCVTLESGWSVSADFIASVQDVVGERVDPKLVERACWTAAADIRPRHLYKTSEFEQSRINVIGTVVERLNLVASLSFQEVAKRLQHHYEALIIYLMLTCFDRLGQPARWRHFGAWLEAHDCKGERERILSQMSTARDPIGDSLVLYRGWTDLYGTSSSFYRFIRHVLPVGARAALLDSIDIYRNTTPPIIRGLPVDDRRKEIWLMRLRNEYTHKAQFLRGIPRSGGFLELFKPDVWVAREQRFEANEWTSVSLRGWPEVLIETIHIGLSQYIVQIATDD